MSAPLIAAAMLLSAAGAEQAVPPAGPIPLVDFQDAAVPSATAADAIVQTAPAPTQDAAPPDEIVVTGHSRHIRDDPLERVNEVSFAVTERVDKVFTGPAAHLYKRVVPHPVRKGVRNFLNNLREPVVFVNYMLQLKPGKAAETAGRFVINSTLGIGGFVDVAARCPFNLPWHPNGFSDTLGVYGVGTGPFLYIPLVGPTTVRDVVGGVVDRLASPFALGGPFRSRPYLIGTNVYRVLDRRAEAEDEVQAIRDSGDPYAARRNLYLEKKRSRVASLKGEEPEPGETEAPRRRCHH